MLRDLVEKNRSYRRFDEGVLIDLETLRELIDLARITPSSQNLQPLKYLISNDPHKNSLIFPHLRWAGYLKDWGGPKPGERPTAYIIILGDREISDTFACGQGIAAQTIMLAATEKGYGGCIMGGFDKDGLRQALDIPPRYEILLVLSLGKPAEVVKIEPLPANGSIIYWRDKEQVHHVPKRSLDDLILD